MTLSVYGRQFSPVPAGETVVITQDLPNTVSYIGATVDGVTISGVTMTLTSNVSFGGLFPMRYLLTYTLSGEYGSDLATQDEYQAINTDNYDPNAPSYYGSENKPFGDYPAKTYNSYSELIAAKGTEWNQIIKFYPDDSPEKTVTFTFTNGTSTETYTQKVHLIPTRHFTRLQAIISDIAPDRVVQDSNGDTVTPSYSSDPPGWT